MPNRTFLVRTRAATIADIKPSTWSNDDYLATEADALPIFWFALFDASSIVTRKTTDEMGKPFSYPTLHGETHAAVERAAQRANALFAVIDPAQRDVFRVFLNYVTHSAPSHLYVEDLELWMMFDPPQYEQRLKQCFAAFAPGASASAWRTILDLANISDPRHVTPEQLAGGSWTRNVPWKTG